MKSLLLGLDRTDFLLDERDHVLVVLALELELFQLRDLVLYDLLLLIKLKILLLGIGLLSLGDPQALLGA